MTWRHIVYRKAKSVCHCTGSPWYLFWLVAIIVLSQFLISKLFLAVVVWKTAAIGTEKIMWIFNVFQWASLQLRRRPIAEMDDQLLTEKTGIRTKEHVSETPILCQVLVRFNSSVVPGWNVLSTVKHNNTFLSWQELQHCFWVIYTVFHKKNDPLLNCA